MSLSVPNDSTHLILCLSKEGDSVKINEVPHRDHCSGQNEFAQKAASCKTHKQVLNFLEKIATLERENSSLQFYHTDNIAYKNHFGTCSKIGVHECSLDQQISFVHQKSMEQEHEVRHCSRNSWCILL